MTIQNSVWKATLLCSFTCLLPAIHAQGTLADYERAAGLRDKLQALAINIPGNVTWISDTGRFWYRKTVQGGSEFEIVEAGTGAKQPAFDHARLAASLSAASGKSFRATTLPFETFTFADNRQAIEFTGADFRWKVTLSDYTCQKLGPVPQLSRETTEWALFARWAAHRHRHC